MLSYTEIQILVALCGKENYSWLISELDAFQSVCLNNLATERPFHIKSQLLLRELWETFRAGIFNYFSPAVGFIHFSLLLISDLLLISVNFHL